MMPGDENARADVESGDYELHRKLKPGDVVLDLGAHVGYFSAHAARRVGAEGLVFAFEPFPRNYEQLELMAQDWPNIITYPIAAWHKNARVLIWSNHGNSGGNSLFRSGSDYTESVLVPAINIGAFVWGMNRRPEFIKIDTEGSEYNIILSLLSHAGEWLKTSSTHIAVEVHSKEMAEGLQQLFTLSGWNFRPKDNAVGIWYADFSPAQ